MPQELNITFYYDNDLNKEFARQVVDMFDPKGKVDLNHSDFTHKLEKTHLGKVLWVQFPFGNKNYKETVFNVIAKANRISSGWVIEQFRPIKQYMCVIQLKNENDQLPKGVNGIMIMVNKK